MPAKRRAGARPRRRTSTASRKAGRSKRKPAVRTTVRIKRVYDAPGPGDGLRILVDRLWPRGLSKARLKLDGWPRQLAPSAALRRWYGHDPRRWNEFRRRYRAELEQRRDGLAQLRAVLRGRRATLLTATRELSLSHAEVLRQVLSRRR